jgi:hypothetical protein
MENFPFKKSLLQGDTMHKITLKVWIFLVSVIFAGLLLLANFVAVVLYIALVVWQ